MKDRYEQTPFLDAIKNDHLEIIKLLKRCGAHLTLSPIQIGAHLCSAANYGNLKRLQSFQAAGANLNQPDVSGRTAIHLAALHNYEDIVLYLLRANVSTSIKDLLGFTAYDMAVKMGHSKIMEIFNSSKPV
uniref:Uncharacterized protein n=3 Tax=Clastoptera arizonana TaxID=38151 RepID=A0A1B6CQ42_9HEMI